MWTGKASSRAIRAPGVRWRRERFPTLWWGLGGLLRGWEELVGRGGHEHRCGGRRTGIIKGTEILDDEFNTQSERLRRHATGEGVSFPEDLCAAPRPSRTRLLGMSTVVVCVGVWLKREPIRLGARSSYRCLTGMDDTAGQVDCEEGRLKRHGLGRTRPKRLPS
ncbi:hypothetical protein VTK26DRAFT_1621 [Humicola hyalothermophila]